MAGAHLLSSHGLQQTFAGNTGGTAEPTAEPPSMHEQLAQSHVLSEMDSILAGGLSPELFLAPAGRILEKASTAIVGPHGGLTPRAGTVHQPGPAGTSVAVRAKEYLNRALGRG
jgi:hypothetical protein